MVLLELSVHSSQNVTLNFCEKRFQITTHINSESHTITSILVSYWTFIQFSANYGIKIFKIFKM